MKQHQDVIEETNRQVEVEGVLCSFVRDPRFSFWSVFVGGDEHPSRYTSFPKAMEAAEMAVKEIDPKKKKAVPKDIKLTDVEKRIPRAKRHTKTKGTDEFIFVEPQK